MDDWNLDRQLGKDAGDPMKSVEIIKIGAYELIVHQSGRLRYAVWRGDDEVCWCATREMAGRIIRALEKEESI